MKMCDCPEAIEKGVHALVTEYIPPNLPMDYRIQEVDRMISCSYCKKILKYFGTYLGLDGRYWTELIR